MIYSMTGFGRAEGQVFDRRVVVELKSVNNRFRDVIVRLPKRLTAIEEEIKKVVGGRVSRGRVDVFLQVDESAALFKRPRLNLELARAYYDVLDQLRRELSLSQEVGLDHLVEYRDVISWEEEDVPLDEFMAALAVILEEALDRLLEMRGAEGEAIAVDFLARLGNMERVVGEIDQRRETVPEETRSRLEARIQALADGVDLDPGRLAQEVAYLADKGDITEEIVRLGSHFGQFRELVGAEGPVGRRLEFLLQEMNREVNTIGSKSGTVDITNRVLDLKTELEKLREQVLNVE